VWLTMSLRMLARRLFDSYFFERRFEAVLLRVVLRFVLARAAALRFVVAFRAVVLRAVVLRVGDLRAVVRRAVLLRAVVLRRAVLRLLVDLRAFCLREMPASDMAIATACLRLFTLRPLLDLSWPRLCSRMTLATLRREVLFLSAIAAPDSSFD
jgi:hypothetical protein